MTCLVIAEAGVNHNASLKLALKLVDIAKDSGADYVKFQTAIPEEVVSNSAQMARYQILNTGLQESQLEMTRKLHLKLEDFVEINNYCKEKEIGFLTTAFDMISLRYISSLGLDIYKIPSGELTNLPYLREVGRFGKPVILSTGMSTMEEVADAIEILFSVGLTNDLLTVLHCTSEYPAPITDVNLNAMLTIKQTFGVKVGYSDHTLGIEIPIAAVAMGATVIEKHFTLSRTLNGPDHRASLEPEELSDMVRGIRKVEKALGDGVKKVANSEIDNRYIVRKSIVAKKDIAIGEEFTTENLTIKRPGSGISPMNWDRIVGGRANRSYKADELIEE